MKTLISKTSNLAYLLGTVFANTITTTAVSHANTKNTRNQKKKLEPSDATRNKYIKHIPIW